MTNLIAVNANDIFLDFKYWLYANKLFFLLLIQRSDELGGEPSQCSIVIAIPNCLYTEPKAEQKDIWPVYTYSFYPYLFLMSYGSERFM